MFSDHRLRTHTTINVCRTNFRMKKKVIFGCGQISIVRSLVEKNNKNFVTRQKKNIFQSKNIEKKVKNGKGKQKAGHTCVCITRERKRYRETHIYSKRPKKNKESEMRRMRSRYIKLKVEHYLLFMFCPPKIS
jgi:hypothetical protein